jgi:hypothetical protein
MFLLKTRPLSLFKDSLWEPHIGDFWKTHFINFSENFFKKNGRSYRSFIHRQLGHLLLRRPFAFCPLLTEGLALSGLSLLLKFLDLFLWRPLKHLSQREGLRMLLDLTFRRKILICIVDLLKVFLHPPPPWKEKLLLGLLIWQYT